MVGQRLKAILLNSRKLGVRNGSASQKIFLWLSTSCKAWRKNKNTHLGLKLSTKLVRVSPVSPVTQWSARRDSVSSISTKENGAKYQLLFLKDSSPESCFQHQTHRSVFYLGLFFVETNFPNCNWTDPPSPPQWLEVSNITRINADLKWQVPSSDGGSPITNYVVEKRDVRRKTWQTVDTTVKDLNYTISPLNEGSLYVFRVAAENSVGMSEFCELEDAVLAKDTFSKFALHHHFIITERSSRLVWQEALDFT